MPPKHNQTFRTNIPANKHFNYVNKRRQQKLKSQQNANWWKIIYRIANFFKGKHHMKPIFHAGGIEKHNIRWIQTKYTHQQWQYTIYTQNPSLALDHTSPGCDLKHGLALGFLTSAPSQKASEVLLDDFFHRQHQELMKWPKGISGIENRSTD